MAFYVRTSTYLTSVSVIAQAVNLANAHEYLLGVVGQSAALQGRMRRQLCPHKAANHCSQLHGRLHNHGIHGWQSSELFEGDGSTLDTICMEGRDNDLGMKKVEVVENPFFNHAPKFDDLEELQGTHIMNNLGKDRV